MTRTPVPSALEQLLTLVKKQVIVDLKAPRLLLVRTLAVPVFLSLYGISNLGAYDEFAQEVTTAKYDTYEGIPLEGFSEALLLNPEATLWLGGEEGVDLGELSSAIVLPENRTSDLVKVFDDINDADTFATMCGDVLSNFTAGIFVHEAEPVWRYSMYVPAASAPDGAVSTVPFSYFQAIRSGVVLAQRLIESAMLSVNGVTNIANQFPLIQQLPTENGNETTLWFLLWLPGFYFCLGVLFMLNICLSPMVADQRKEVVRQFTLLGVPRWVYWMHWVASLSLFMIVTAALTAVAIIEMKFAALANGFLVFLASFLALVHFACLAVIVPNYVTKDEVAGIVPFFAWILSSLSYIPVLSIASEPSQAVQVIMTILNPNWGVFHFITVLVEYDWPAKNVGVSFSNIVESGFLYALLSQLAGILVYTSIILHLYMPKRSHISLTEEEEARARAQNEASSLDADLEPLSEDAKVVVSVNGLTKSFIDKTMSQQRKATKKQVLRGLNMEICKGEVFGFLGHNGAGKTTALKILAGEMTPDGGLAEFRFKQATIKVGHGKDNVIRSRIGFCPQHDLLFDDLTCREHLQLFAKLKGGIEIGSGQTKDQAIEAEVEKRLAEVKFTSDGDEDKAVKTYSGGMKRKVSIAIALLGDPEVVFLDEPTAGMDPYNRRIVWEMISAAKIGRSVILTTHFMDEAEVLSDRIGILNKGKLVACGASLFLKHRFGAGYTLSYMQRDDSDTTAIAKTLQSQIPEAKRTVIDGKDHKKQAWTIPFGFEDSFPQVLNALDRSDCFEVAMDLTTLEDVFLSIGSEDLSGGGRIEADEAATALEPGSKPSQQRESNEKVLDIALDKDQMARNIWGPQDKKVLSSWEKVKVVAKVTARQSRRNFESVIFGTLMPIGYVVAGMVVGSIAGSGTQLVVPDPVPLDFRGLDGAQSLFTVFGSLDANPGTFSEGIQSIRTVPNSTQAFFEGSTPYLGGLLQNGTMMFNGTTLYGIMVMQSFLANFTFRNETSGLNGVQGQIVRLPFVLEDDFPITPFLLPMLLGVGFVGLSFLVVDLAFYKEYKLYSVFRIMGAPRTLVYAGATLQSLLLAFAPFVVVTFVLAFALQSAIVGSGGRWLALILLFMAYAVALVPFSLMFEPLFPNLKAAKDYFPFITIMMSVVPFVVFNVSKGSELVGDILCILPPFAFQRALSSLIQLSEEYDDPTVTWGRVFGWEARVMFCIVALLVVSILSSFVVSYQVRRAQVSSGKGGDLKPVPTTDSDVELQRTEAQNKSSGISIRNAVKHFRVPKDNGASGPCAQKEMTIKEAVKGVSAHVEPNEIFVLLGPNGAGKTVLTQMCIRDLKPDGGSIVLDHNKLESLNDSSKMYNQGDFAYCPQFDALFTSLTVEEHFEFVVQFRGLNPKSEAVKRHVSALQDQLGLSQYLKKKTEFLSGGYKRKLSFALALVGNPKVAFFDEVSTGVDPSARHNIWAILKPNATDLKLPAILLSTHYMDEAEALASRIGIMIDGEMITTGTLPQLQDKHCNKNLLEVTFVEGYPTDVEDRLVESLEAAGHQVAVTESLIGRVKLEINIEDMTQNTKNLASLFKHIESIKSSMHIGFYHLSLQSLEQIFIDLSRKQFDPAEMGSSEQ